MWGHGLPTQSIKLRFLSYWTLLLTYLWPLPWQPRRPGSAGCRLYCSWQPILWECGSRCPVPTGWRQNWWGRWRRTYVRVLLRSAVPCCRNDLLCLGRPCTKKQLYLANLVVINPLNPELNPICYLLALLGAHHFLHVSKIRVKLLTFRLLMSYIQGVTGGRDKTSGECSLC